MAVRSISVTDTLETFRTQFNALAANDFGDIATLDPTLSATSVIGAVNELSSQVAASLGIFIEDASSTRQQIGAGQTIFMLGTSNEVEVTVSATDTMTVGLPNNVTISNNLTVTNNLTTTGTSTLGSIQISGNTITASDSSVISLSTDSLSTSGAITGGTGTFTSVVSSGVVSGTTITATGDISTSEQFVLTGAAKGIVFEGATADANELTLKALGPSADVTVSIPSLGANANLVTTGDTGTVTSTMILNGTIVNADIADSTIRAAKLNLSADTLVAVSYTHLTLPTIYSV